LDHRLFLALDHRLLDVRVDTAEHARDEIITEQRRFRGDRLSVVVALVKREHRVGDGGAELVASQGSGGSRHAAFSLTLRIGGHVRQRGENQTSYRSAIAAGEPASDGFPPR
jgi:hypothetical protein